MDSYRSFHDELYEPVELFRLAYRFASEIAHAFPTPDQVAWLLSFPVVFVPLVVMAVSYAIGFYLTLAALYGLSRAYDEVSSLAESVLS